MERTLVYSDKPAVSAKAEFTDLYKYTAEAFVHVEFYVKLGHFSIQCYSLIK